MAQNYSDLEVVYNQQPPEVVASHSEKFVLVDSDSPLEVVPSYYDPTQAHNQHGRLDYDASPPPPRRRICSLSPRRFWLCLLLALLLLVGGIVGGVLGGLRPWETASSSSSSSGGGGGGEGSGDTPAERPQGQSGASTGSGRSTTSTASSDKAPEATPPPPTRTQAQPTTASLTTSTMVRATQTMLRDCPSSNGTAYEPVAGQVFLKFCGAGPAWVAGHVDVVHRPAVSLDQCVDQCMAYNLERRAQIAGGVALACNAVAWRNDINDPDWPGQCFGSQADLGAGAYVPLGDETIVDSAMWINRW